MKKLVIVLCLIAAFAGLWFYCAGKQPMGIEIIDCNFAQTEVSDSNGITVVEGIEIATTVADVEFALGGLVDAIIDANNLLKHAEATDIIWADITTPPNFVITSADGNEVVIDFSGDEVVVSGANEEGAKLFFEVMLKPIIDDYISRQ